MTDLTNPIYSNNDAARKHLEGIRWANGAFCPHCGEIESVQQLGGAAKAKGLWHCRSCRRKFSVTVGTVFERSHIPLCKWLFASDLMTASKKGVSAHQLHRSLGITYKSAWFMAHRSRSMTKCALLRCSKASRVVGLPIGGLCKPTDWRQIIKKRKR